MEDLGYRHYQRFLDGDPLGFEEIVKQYRNNLILFIQQFVRDYPTAEDISQNVFVKLYLKKPTYSPNASFKTWLYTIAKREALNHVKKQRRHVVVEYDSNAFFEVEQDYLETILADDRATALHRVLNDLKAEYRQVLYLCYFEDMTVNEMARLLKKKPQQVSDLLYNAKKTLKSVITKGGNQYEILRSGIE